MSNDLSEFLDIFFEECFEGLAIMESGLIALDSENVDSEEINTIFRAAHSIKGGAATFEMNDVAEFTHVMETLLDEMRDGRRAVSRAAVDLLLASLDGLTAMINALRAQEPTDKDQIAELKSQLEQMLAGSDDAGAEAAQTAPAEQTESATAAASTVPATAEDVEWTIEFCPGENLYASGNDPQHIFRALQELGELKIEARLDDLPSLKELVPEKCRLSWTLVLQTDANEEALREPFAWVEDESELTFTCTTPVPANIDADSDANATVPEESAAKDAAAGETQTATQSAPIQQANKPDKAPSRAVPAKSGQGSAGSESASIRVSIDKVDDLINLVGELVITQSMLSRFAEGVEDNELETLRTGLTALTRHTRELQETAMQIRMLPISTCFNRFPRLVRDLSAKLGKNIELQVSGGGTELDKTVLEKINDPLVHLVRNSMDHGIESPEVRRDAGKPESGVLRLNAYHKGGNIVIEVIDDGAGLNTEKILEKAKERGLVARDADLSDQQINNLIFQPGFSTAESVSDLSGRGVGMDVVRRNIQDLGGSVHVESAPGKGSKLTISLPLTLAILDGQLVQVGDQTYIISLVSIVESLQVTDDRSNDIAGGGEVYHLRDEFIPIVRLHELFDVTPTNTELGKGLLVVVEAGGGRIGLFVDDLLGQQQVVIKSLESNYRQVDGLSGATILGDGTVALILDVPGLVQLAGGRSRTPDQRQAA